MSVLSRTGVAALATQVVRQRGPLPLQALVHHLRDGLGIDGQRVRDGLALALNSGRLSHGDRGTLTIPQEPDHEPDVSNPARGGTLETPFPKTGEYGSRARRSRQNLPSGRALGYPRAPVEGG